MSESLKERLIQYKENKIGCKPDDYVITDLDGKELKILGGRNASIVQ